MRFGSSPASRFTSKAKGRWRPISFIENRATHTLFSLLPCSGNGQIRGRPAGSYDILDSPSAEAQVGFSSKL